MACIEELEKTTKPKNIEDQMLVLMRRQVETELKLEKNFRELCEEVSNAVKEREDVVEELERLSGSHVVKESTRLLRRGSSSRLTHDQSSNPSSSTNTTPKGLNRRSSKQSVENSNLEEHLPPVVTMADNRTMAELLRAPTEGYAEAIVVPPILAEQFELKYSLINMMTTDQFFVLEKDNPHDHIRWGSPTTSLRNEISNFQQRFDESFHEAWDRYKDLLRACPHHGFIELKQLNTFYNALNPADQDSLNAAAGENLLEKINQQTSAMTTATMAMLKQFQATPPPAPVKAVEEICFTRGGAHPYYQCLAAGGNIFLELKDNIQGYVSAATVNYNQAQQNQNFHLKELEKIKRMNEANMKAMQTQINMVKNELRNEMKTSIQTSLSNQTNEIKNMMASLLQMNIASTSCGLVTDGPTVPTPPKFSTSEVDECVKETYTDPDLAEYTIKVPPPPVQKYKPSSHREFVVHQRDPRHPNIPYPSRMLKQKQQEKDEVQIQKFRQMFKQLHVNITLADALILMPNELKCKALADLGASINVMPLSVWKKLGLPEIILTRMTLKLGNHAICTPAGIARDVFVPVGKFTFPADFVIVDYESDPRVSLILGRPILRTARALIDVHGEEMILRDGDKRLTLNMRHDTSSYSNQPSRESINLINIFNVSSEDFLEDLFLHQPSGNPTFSPHPELTSPEVNHDINDSEGCNEFTDKLALITYPSDYDDNLQFDIKYDLKEIEFLLYQGKDSILKDSIDKKDLANLDDNFVDPIHEMFTDEHTPDYSYPLIFDEYGDDFLEVESDFVNVNDASFDSKEEKIKEFKLLIDELDLLCDFLPPSEYDSFNSLDFSKDKRLEISNASLVPEDFDPSFYEPLFFKEVPKILKSLMKISLVYCGKDTPILDVLLFHFYPP
nr:hypothetical protein [Tanacetum cinerariifolium]